MYYIVGLRTSLLLLILPCICPIFFLYILRMMNSFVKDFCETVQARVLIFGMQVDNDVLYRGIATSLLLILPYIYLFFFLSIFFVKDISTTVYDRNFKFGIQVHNDKLYHGIENGPSPICSSLYLFFFLSLQIFRQRYLYNRLR